MTVQELMDKLKELPPDMVVVVRDDDEQGPHSYYPITSVDPIPVVVTRDDKYDYPYSWLLSDSQNHPATAVLID